MKASNDDQEEVIGSSERRDAVASLRESRLPQQTQKKLSSTTGSKGNEELKRSAEAIRSGITK